MNYFTDNNEWKWLLKNGLDWKTILPLYYKKFPTEEGFENSNDAIEFFQELLTATGEWCGSNVEGRAARLEKEGAGEVTDGKTIPGPALLELYKEAKELDIFGISISKKYGGLELPISLSVFGLQQISRACVASGMQICFYACIAEMIERFASKELKEKYVPQIISGEISGSMCLTEADCGSDLGAIKTTASPNDDGTYSLNGSKIFITNAGGGLGLVLARIDGGPEGLAGISMFLADQNDGKNGELNFQVTKNEEKMGLHGTFTCEVLYENSRAHLIGEKNTGFKLMLHLMNEARLATSMQAVGGIEASIYYAKKYANEREAFGRPIAQLPLLKRNLNDFEAELDAIRALCVDTCSHFDIYQRLHLKKQHSGDLTKEEKEIYEDAKLWVRKRVPLVKYYATEAYTQLSTKAIQVLGGYGFMKDYPVEKYHRDSFGPLLYEGTSQIQSLMALKDVVKYAFEDPTQFFSNIFYKHPGFEFLNRSNAWSYEFKALHYRFKKKLVALLFNNLRPDSEKMFRPKNWTKLDEEKVSSLMIHAETLCQALSYMETLRVLCSHSNIDEDRSKLFFNYQKIVHPRLEAIYTDWSNRS